MDKQSAPLPNGDLVEELHEHWKHLCDNQYTLKYSARKSLAKFAEALGRDEVIDAMEIAAERFSIDKIEARFKYFCGICHNKIRSKSGDPSDEVFNKARYYFRSQSSGSGYLREPQLRLFSRRYSLDTIKQAIDIAFSCRRGNYWNAVCEALAELTGDEIDI